MTSEYLIKLICIPYAGGSAVTYYGWRNRLDCRADLVPLELSGRGERLSEPLYENFSQMFSDMYAKLLNDIHNCDYVLFGHSMGNTLAFELAREVIKQKQKPPAHVIFSGRLPPDLCQKSESYDLSNIICFKSWIKNIGGPVDILFDNPVYSRHFLPALISDYHVISDYRFNGVYEPFPFGITVISGTDDPCTNPDGLRRWKQFTEKGAKFYEIPGDHFFINSAADKTLCVINGVIDELLRGRDSCE